MFKAIFVVNYFLILVTSNPWQGFQPCPLIYHQNYFNNDQSASASNFNAYDEQINSYFWPPSQIDPNYQDNRYYGNFLKTSVPTSIYDNINIYKQNDFAPYSVQSFPNSLTNYVLVPENYLNSEKLSSNNIYLPTSLDGYNNENSWLPADYRRNVNHYDPTHNPFDYVNDKSKRNHSKQRSNSELSRNRNENKCDDRKSSKNNKRRKNKCTDPRNNEEQCNQKTKLSQKTCAVESNTSNRQEKRKNSNRELDKKQKARRKSESCQCDENIKLNKEKANKSTKECTLKEDNTECLDIHGECACLENRCPRNDNKHNQDQTSQQPFLNLPKEFSSYFSNLMPYNNFDSNLFNGNFNFDYLFQQPQQSNLSSNDNENRRKKRKKKKSKSNRKSNAGQSSNKEKNEEGCNKVVELSPKPIKLETEVETKSKEEFLSESEPLTLQDHTAEIKNKDKKIPDIVNKPNIEIVIEPFIFVPDEHNLNNAASSQEYVPNVYENDIFDDYYPDFTSDRIYSSKEEDWNFHNRHFYTSDNKAEMSRETRKYDSSSQEPIKAHKIDNPKSDTPNIEREIEMKKPITEIKFKTPPGLEFPDFKTEMVSKKINSPKDDIYFEPNKEKTSSLSQIKSSGNKANSSDNTVETVYARSKVAKYGGSDSNEKTHKKPNNSSQNIKGQKNQPTIVVARTMNPENLK